MIKHLQQISGSPYHFKALEAFVETVLAGNGDGSAVIFNWDDKVSVILSRSGELQGLIVWRHLKWLQQVWICQGWVEPKYRRRGLYTKLYRAVKAEAKKLGARTIAGGVKPANVAMIAAAKRQGRKVVCVTVEEAL